MEPHSYSLVSAASRDSIARLHPLHSRVSGGLLNLHLLTLTEKGEEETIRHKINHNC